MDLILWRHAEAEDGAPDLQRRLTTYGHAQAARVAAWMQRHLPPGYRVLASPALRAQQTAQALNAPINTVPELAPGASVDAILEAAGPRGCVVVVGHQPDLGKAIAYLVCGEAREWAIEKGALWWISGRNRLRAVISPELI